AVFRPLSSTTRVSRFADFASRRVTVPLPTLDIIRFLIWKIASGGTCNPTSPGRGWSEGVLRNWKPAGTASLSASATSALSLLWTSLGNAPATTNNGVGSPLGDRCSGAGVWATRTDEKN